MYEFWDTLPFAQIGLFINDYKFISSVLLLGCFLIIKQAVVRLLRRRYQRGTNKRIAVNSFKNIVNLIALLLFISLWSGELQNLHV